MRDTGWLSLPAKTERKPVVPFSVATDRLLLLDFTEKNKSLSVDILNDMTSFAGYIDQQLLNAGARYGIGGYDEHRTVYSRSKVFDAREGEEPRRLHLGIDIWGKAGTPVSAPLDGFVHSFAFNDQFGDYGATIILEHHMPDRLFYSLYGHLSLNDITGLAKGQTIHAGQEFAHFGKPDENGHWPPHLHFQLIRDMEGKEGDYPGVCALPEREKYLKNCPDPDGLLGMLVHAKTDFTN